MKKLAPLLILSIIACSTRVAVQAQNDSTRLDAGVLKFRREFTQSITIKGADLEKMPFANLNEAIDVWLYGAYGNSSTLVYVVDGNLVSDVNAYSVYDIEEVVAVLNAAADLEPVRQPGSIHFFCKIFMSVTGCMSRRSSRSNSI